MDSIGFDWIILSQSKWAGGLGVRIRSRTWPARTGQQNNWILPTTGYDLIILYIYKVLSFFFSVSRTPKKSNFEIEFAKENTKPIRYTLI